jgi:thiol-disulfide isomerase/thioredoxin
MRTSKSAHRWGLSVGLGLLLLSPVSAWPAGPAYEILPRARIAKEKLKPCALIHVWATWCVPCIDELPKFLSFVANHRKINPVVIDISGGYVQDNFSKKWLTQLAPPFMTYLKPDKENKEYLNAIDSPWPGKLPYNGLFDRGKKKGQWLGTSDFSKLGADISRLCK